MKNKSSLLNSGEWFNVLKTHLSMVFYALDRNGVFTLSEGLGLSKLGLVPGQVVGLSVFDVYKDFPDILAAIKQALTGVKVVIEHNIGDYYVENSLVPQYDENNEVSGLICVAVDICERNIMEQSLKKERNLLKAIFDSVPGILYLYNDKGNLVQWNKNHEEISGYSSEEMSKMNLLDWFKDNEEDQKLIAREVEVALQGKVTSSDANLRIKSGDTIPMHFTAAGLIIDGMQYIAGIGIDISELKSTQQELMDINKSLEDKVLARTKELSLANEELTASYTKMREMQSYLIQSEKMSALGNLVAGITHEINTPIGIGITAASHLMEITQEIISCTKSEDADKENIISYLEDMVQASNIILKNLDRAGKLVRSFKQVSADQASEPKRQFNVKEYLDEILISLSPKLNKTKLTITVHCDALLVIDGYPGAFAQIISNLIINSLIHAYNTEDKGNICISISKVMDMAEIVYSDDGKGILSSDISKIFDPFFTTNRGAGGTGIGLSLVYNIVTQTFGGTIHCDSHINKGTTFVIRLKLGGI